MSQSLRLLHLPLLFVAAILGLTFNNKTIQAAVWTNASGGSWIDGTNWNTNPSFPNATGAVADFSRLDITSDTTITLDGNITAGTLQFGDIVPSNNWIVNPGTSPGDTLTLSVSSGTPIINVANPTADPSPPTGSSTLVSQSATINAIIAGNQGLTKTGFGTLVLTNTNTYTGATSVNAGGLTLDFSPTFSPASNIIASGSALSLGGGLTAGTGATLTINGSSGGTNSQSFSSTTLNFGGDAINVTQNGAASVNLALGTVTAMPEQSSILLFPRPETSARRASSIPNVNGIIGALATVGSGTTAGWAANDGSGNIIAAPSSAYTNVTGAPAIVSNAASNVLWSGSTGNATTSAGTTDINTLMYTDAAARTLNVASGSTLRVGPQGGIFKTDTTAGNALSIGSAGSFLTAGGPTPNNPGELVLNANVNIGSVAGTFTPDTSGIFVNSSITDNGSGAVSVIKDGNATVQLNAADTYSGGSYVYGGRLRAQTVTGFGTGPVYVAAGGQAYLNVTGTYANQFFISGKGFIESATTTTPFAGGALCRGG